ncbi:MAG: hypothetical protein U0802_13705 [Candidatus Binatia bacterium]
MTPVRFTTSGDGTYLYAIVMGPLPADEITIVGLAEAAGTARPPRHRPATSPPPPAAPTPAHRPARLAAGASGARLRLSPPAGS